MVQKSMALAAPAVILVLLVVAGSAAGQTPPIAQRIAYDFTAMYDAINPSILKIHADAGTGSGFIVSGTGLVATNHHVVRNSRYLAVQLADGRKLAADIVTLDPRYDVAILKVNPEALVGLEPLRLLPAERDGEVRAGVPVVAFGSPLSQTFLMTQGIVSKVEPEVLLGDFLIQPGNSGGPLVNLSGEVVGINTFANGGISGAVRVESLRRVLASAEVTSYDQPAPPADCLPTVTARYPVDVLKEKLLKEPLDQDVYVLDGGKFTITALTPVLVGKAQVQPDMQQAQNRMKRRGKKVGDPTWKEVDGPFYEWLRSDPMLAHAVTFEIKPDFGTTAGSKWAAAFAGLAAGLSKTPVAMPHQTMEFKAEFQDFKLYRDGQLVAPIHPGRAVTEASFQGPMVTFVDEAYSGMYQYDPAVFVSGNQFRIEVFDAREPGKVHKTIVLDGNSKLIKQLRSDFAGTDGK